MKVIAILQARTSSSRLPGKVLKEILGKPLLELQIEREKRSKIIEKLIIATSEEPSDQPIEDLCNRLGIECFRGNLNNVLDRFYQAARKYEPEYIVRLTGDCPLVDPDLVDQVIDFCIQGNFDYATNAIEATFPDGLDLEVFRFTSLKEAWQNAKLPSQLEHVTPYINRQPEKFKIGHFKGFQDLSDLRWTVDEVEDFELVKTIYENLYPQKPEFTTNDILQFLEENKHWMTYNIKHERNAGYKKSLQEERFLVNTKKKNFRLRECVLDDSRLLFDWVNEPIVRLNSKNREPVVWETHERWLKEKLNNPNSKILILEDQKPLGQIRFDFQDDTQSYLIDFSIDKRFRGNSLGQEIIYLGMQELVKIKGQSLSFSAFVKKDNYASIKSFIKNKFEIVDEDNEYHFLRKTYEI